MDEGSRDSYVSVTVMEGVLLIRRVRSKVG